MRRFLLATAAAAALALAAPMAGAQYAEPNPSDPVYSSPADPEADEQQTAVPNATPPFDSQTTAAPSTTTSTQSQTYAQPSTTGTTTTQSYADSQPSTTTTATTSTQTYASPDPNNSTYGTPQSAAGAPGTSYATQSPNDQSYQSSGYAQNAAAGGEDITMSATMAQYAQEAGMRGVPMTAAEVCAPRDIELAQGTSRLNRETRRQLRFAADRASACEIQRVVINAPDGRGAAVRQTLVEHGVDDAMIEVERADDGGLGVEMQFAGVAASTAEYAAMFNSGAMYASNTQTSQGAMQPSSYASPSTTTSGYQPTSYSPGASTSSPSSSYSGASPYGSTPSTTSTTTSSEYDSPTSSTDTMNSSDELDQSDSTSPDPLY